VARSGKEAIRAVVLSPLWLAFAIEYARQWMIDIIEKARH
jgi:hypothetical protein